MLEFIWHSLFSLVTATAAFYAGVKLTERHLHEKEGAVQYAHQQVEHYHRTHYVHAIEPTHRPNMTAPAPMPPAVHAPGRFDAALAPDGPVADRLAQNGQATIFFPGKHMN